ncbi:lantibiotic dehydratase family protein [Flavobacterium sp.]|uniref:lantibiotic dehydratase family protein n=1 Tax=Flavobacterium sp. TaxID=239 RepID=UPI0040472CD5
MKTNKEVMNNKIKFSAFPTAVLRTPLFPVSSYVNLMNAYSIDALFGFAKNSFVKNALALASPELWLEIEKYLENPSRFSAEKIKALEIALLKYVARMCARATPFGMFAACTTVTLGKKTAIALAEKENYKAHTQFDMQFWIAFLQEVAKDPTVKEQLLYFPNTSLYAVGDFYRYIEYKFNAKKRREHSISAVRCNAFVAVVLELTATGKTKKELVDALIDEESEREEATEFVNELIASQIIVSNLEATVTGSSENERVLTLLSGLKNADTATEKVSVVLQGLENLNLDFQQYYEQSKAIVSKIEQLHVAFEPKYLLQTDLYSATTIATINTANVGKLKQAIDFLSQVQKTAVNGNLEAFRKAFFNRYETKSMPLSVVLDAEIGIGYLQNSRMNDSHPLLDKLPINSAHATSETENWTSFDYVLERKLQEALANNETVLELKESDFKKNNETVPNLPATFSAMVEIIKEEDNEILVLESLGSYSAAKLIGRFCNGDATIHALAKEIVQHEAACAPDAILAEVAHIPESRTGNILRRPVLRPYEIPYLSNSVVPNENQILIDDLWITVERNTIVLKSKRLNKEIVPCLSNAHNYSSNALPIYQFLCDLQGQNSAPVYRFDWGVLKQHYNYFPRVVYKEVILAKARWYIYIEEVKGVQFGASFVLWKEKMKLPKYVNIVSGDNTLLLDLETEICFDILMRTIKKNQKVVIEEFLFATNSVVHDSSKNHYANQFVFSFGRE